MWKKSLFRGVSSYCVCVTVAVLVGMITGLCGAQRACMPEFAERVGSEVTAAFLQPLLIGLIGFAFGASSVFFEIECWSFLKQGAAHLTVTVAVWIAVELICFSPISVPAVISFAASAVATYAITWGIQYFVWRSRVRRINEQIHLRNEEEQS